MEWVNNFLSQTNRKGQQKDRKRTRTQITGDPRASFPPKKSTSVGQKTLASRDETGTAPKVFDGPTPPNGPTRTGARLQAGGPGVATHEADGSFSKKGPESAAKKPAKKDPRRGSRRPPAGGNSGEVGSNACANLALRLIYFQCLDSWAVSLNVREWYITYTLFTYATVTHAYTLLTTQDYHPPSILIVFSLILKCCNKKKIQTIQLKLKV